MTREQKWKEIQEAIIKARERGAYEAAEHYTSEYFDLEVEEMREDKRNEKLIKKYGKCKSCNGRGYLGTYDGGTNCPACKGLGCHLRKVPGWKGKK